MPLKAITEQDFIGRKDELADLTGRILQADRGFGRSIVLSGPRGIGKTELLKQLFGALFWKQSKVVPFYYSVNPALLSAAAFARSYLIRFLCQRLAFEKKEQSLFYDEGMSIESLSILLEDRNIIWARELLDQYERSSGDVTTALRIALAAPHRSALATGQPVAVLIDDFHRLHDLHIDRTSDPHLVSLFEEPLSYRKTPHVLAGNAAELQDLPVTCSLERLAVQPLSADDALSRVRTLMLAHEAEGVMPPLLLRHLGGNPHSLSCVINTVCAQKKPDEKDFWNAYIHEINRGQLALSRLSGLKSFFPDLGARRIALAITHKIYHTREPLSCQRIAKSFALTDVQTESVMRALYLAGLINGEFGVFRAIEDGVLRDIIDCLFMKEVLAKSSRDLDQEFLNKLIPQTGNSVRFDLTLPMAKEVELVAAQCLEQIGKNLALNPDAIGQLQIAVIEACINVIEHSKGTDNKIYVTVELNEDLLEVAIESAGQEFIVLETGEPYGDREGTRAPGRGWGIKLMKRFVDTVRFEKTERGTRTVLIKKLGESAMAQRGGEPDRE